MSSSQRRGALPDYMAGGLVAIATSWLAVLFVSERVTFPLTVPGFFSLKLSVTTAALAVVIAVAWQLCGVCLGGDAPDATEDLWTGLGKLLSRSIIVTLLLGAYLACFATHAHILQIMGSFCGSAVLCDLLRIALISGNRRPLNRVVIVGSNRLAAKAWRDFRTHPRRGMELAGFVDEGTCHELPPDFASRYLGEINGLPRLVIEHRIDDVIVAVPVAPEDTDVQQAISLSGALGARILCVKQICGISPENSGRDYGDTFFELIPAPDLGGIVHFLKRTSDIVIGSLLLLILSAVLAGVVVWEAIRGRSVAFHSCQNIGFRRKPFRSSQLVRESGHTPLQPWVSNIPLIWNVLKGDMSFVGPAPLGEEELCLEEVDVFARRFNVRPGLTGVLARHSAEPDYIEDMDSTNGNGPSFSADMRTLARTLRSLTRRTQGAQRAAGVI